MVCNGLLGFISGQESCNQSQSTVMLSVNALDTEKSHIENYINIYLRCRYPHVSAINNKKVKICGMTNCLYIIISVTNSMKPHPSE